MPNPQSGETELTSITNHYFMPEVKDLVHDQNVFWKRLSERRRLVPGGDKIVQPLLYQFSQDGSYFPFAKGSTTAEDQITRAEYNWKWYRQRIVISEEDLDRNSGPEAVFDLLDTKVKGAGMAIRDALGTDAFTAANGDSSSGINSLENLLGDATEPSGNLTSGGIDKSTNAFFQGTNYDFQSNTLGIADDMLQADVAIEDGSIKPNLVISHPDPQRVHQQEVMGVASAPTGGLSRNVERFVNTSSLSSGFAEFEFRGKPWITDLHCPTDRLFFLNMDFMHMVVHKKRDFQLKPFMQPEDAFVNIAWIKWGGNITSSDPSRSGFMYT